jgi:hypothetical protein
MGSLIAFSTLIMSIAPRLPGLRPKMRSTTARGRSVGETGTLPGSAPESLYAVRPHRHRSVDPSPTAARPRLRTQKTSGTNNPWGPSLGSASVRAGSVTQKRPRGLSITLTLRLAL